MGKYTNETKHKVCSDDSCGNYFVGDETVKGELCSDCIEKQSEEAEDNTTPMMNKCLDCGKDVVMPLLRCNSCVFKNLERKEVTNEK